jgi:serine/threonine protein kinase
LVVPNTALGGEEFLHRDVAVKFLRPDVASAELGPRFVREARALAALSHANIVHIYDVKQTDDGATYLVMELVEGISLAQRLRKRPVPLDAVHSILAQLAAALDEAHGQGIVHRDVKPSNILINERTGRVVLTDFGIARAPLGSSSPAAPSRLRRELRIR